MASRGMIMIRQQAVTETSYILNDTFIDLVDLEYRVNQKVTGANAHTLKGHFGILLRWRTIMKINGKMPDEFIDLAVKRYHELNKELAK